MRKFKDKFFGVRDGKIYPETVEPGDDCPPELIEAADSVGALQELETRAAKKAPERK